MYDELVEKALLHYFWRLSAVDRLSVLSQTICLYYDAKDRGEDVSIFAENESRNGTRHPAPGVYKLNT